MGSLKSVTCVISSVAFGAIIFYNLWMKTCSLFSFSFFGSGWTWFNPFSVAWSHSQCCWRCIQMIMLCIFLFNLLDYVHACLLGFIYATVSSFLLVPFKAQFIIIVISIVWQSTICFESALFGTCFRSMDWMNKHGFVVKDISRCARKRIQHLVLYSMYIYLWLLQVHLLRIIRAWKLTQCDVYYLPFVVLTT